MDGKLFADLFGQGLDLFDQGGHDHIPGDLRLSVAAAGAAGCGDQPAYSTAGLDVLRERGYGRREARSAPVARPLQTSKDRGDPTRQPRREPRMRDRVSGAVTRPRQRWRVCLLCLLWQDCPDRYGNCCDK